MGTVLKHPTPRLPMELEAAIESARASDHRYMIAVWRVDDEAKETIHLQLSRGDKWKFDWLLRAFAMFRDMIIASPLPDTTTNPTEAEPAKG